MKKMMTTFLNFLFSFSLAGQVHASQGGWSGNGGEPMRMAENVWFLDQDTIPYCVLASDSYPVPLDQLKVMVRESFNQWFDFLKVYGIDGQSKAVLPARGTDPALPRLTMATNFMEVECPDPKRSFTAEKIRFQFGISNSLIDAYRVFNPEEPLGVAMKKSNDTAGMQTYGYVWIDDFSRDVLKVRHLLLHEIGHVLGMNHNSVFVMNQDVVQDLKGEVYHDFLGSIESSFWPYRLRSDSTVDLSLTGFARPAYALSQGPQFCSHTDPVAKDLFKEWGLKPQLCYDITLSTQHIDSHKIKVLLEIKDSGHTVSLQGEFRPFPLTGFLPKGPKFQTITPDRQKWAHYIFDPAAALDSWQGNFIVGGRPMAAQLFLVKGVALHLYLPSLKNWVMLRSNSKQ